MKKIHWWRWIGVVLGSALLIVALVLFCYYIIWMRMGSSLQNKAEAVLAKGVTVTDPARDFVTMGSNKEEVMSTDTNNLNPYVIDYLDIKSIQSGADDQYLFYRVNYYNTIPKWPKKVNDDEIIAIGNKFHILNEKGEETIVIHFDFGYEPIVRFGALNTYYDYCPTGIEWPEDARMRCHGQNNKIVGGGGTDYVMGALPMKDVDLALGQIIFFTVDEETKSSQYTHAAVDMLGTNGKESQIIKWTIGSDKYELVDLPDPKNSGSKK